MNHGRRDHSSSSVPGKVYVFGGYDDFFDHVNSIEVYSVSQDEWTMINGLTYPYNCASITSITSSSMVIIGGWDHDYDKDSDKIYHYDTEKD